MHIIIGLDLANSVQILDWSLLAQKTKQLNYGTLVQDNKLVPSKIRLKVLTQSSFIQTEHVWPVEDKIRQSRSGISEVRDLFRSTMPIPTNVTKLTFTLMGGICYLVVMTPPWRYGIWDKVIFSTPFTAMKVHQRQLPSRHAETTLPLEEVTLLSWYGKVISMKMNKNSSRTLVPKLDKIIPEESHPSRENLLLREQQPPESEQHRKSRPPLLKSHRLEEPQEQPAVTSTTMRTLPNQMTQTPSVEVVKSLPKH